MAEPRGAGPAGGLLFLAVVLFVGYLAVRAVAGLIKLAVAALVLVAIGVFLANVLRRR